MRKRRGVSLLEAAAALVLMAAASVVLAQVLHAMAGQRRDSEQRLLAQQVAMQQVERWLQQPLVPVAIDSQLDVTLPANVRDVLPESNCLWEIKSQPPTATDPAALRLTVTVAWKNGPSRLPRSVRLVSYKYQSAGATP